METEPRVPILSLWKLVRIFFGRQSLSELVLSKNPHLYRRKELGLLLVLAYPALKMLSLVLSRKTKASSQQITLFQSYQVGDFMMALPAIRLLARHVQVTVVGRPDCLFLLKDIGVQGIPFSYPFFSDSSLTAFWKSIRNAWALRGKIQGTVLDTDADPRTVLFMKIAGAGDCISYRRNFGWLFDKSLPLFNPPHHQVEKNEAVALAYIHSIQSQDEVPKPAATRTDVTWKKPNSGTLLLSCWTRRPEKNWPLDRWSKVIEMLRQKGRPICILNPPDADAPFRKFQAEWQGRVEFFSGDLETLYARLHLATGVITTDNFLGHMGAFLDKPVAWINGSSDETGVVPYGSNTHIIQVETMPCRPCRHHCTNPVYRKCLLDLTTQKVMDEINTWLGN